MILENVSRQRNLDAYMRTVLYDFEEYAAQNQLLLQKLKRIRLIFNGGDKCYTNEKTIVIGKEFSVFNSTDNAGLVYKRAQGVIVHEIAHILYTNFREFSTFFNTAPQKYKKLAKVSKDIFNILEDFRIEETISQFNPYFKKLFLMVRYEVTKNLKEKLRARAKSGMLYNDDQRASFMINSLLVMGFTKKPFLSGDKRTDQLIRTAYVYTMKAIKATDTKDITNYSDKIMKLIQKLDVDDSRDIDLDDDAFDMVGSNRPKGSNDPLSTGGTGVAGGAGVGGNLSNKNVLPSGVVEDIAANLEASEEAANELEDDTDEAFDQIEDDFQEELGNIEKQNVIDRMINGYFNGEKKEKEQQTKLNNEKRNIEHFVKSLPKIHEGVALKFRERMDRFGEEDYEDHKQRLSLEIKRAVDKIVNLKQTVLDDYEYNLKSGSIDASSLVRFSAFDEVDIFKQLYPEEETMKMDVMLLIDCSGSNGSSVLNKKNDENLPRYIVNQMMAIYLHEILKQLEFKHSIWGFDSGKVEQLSPMVTFQNCFDQNSGLNLADIAARGANRDGYHIRLAGKMLDANAESEKKLLIVLSDGQPSSYGYHGEAAMKDVIDAQEELKEFGVKTIGIFTGHKEENRYFEDLYENREFLNNDSIVDFPSKLHDILAKEFEEDLEI